MEIWRRSSYAAESAASLDASTRSQEAASELSHSKASTPLPAHMSTTCLKIEDVFNLRPFRKEIYEERMLINQIKPAGILLTVLSAPIFGDMLPPDFGSLAGVIFWMQQMPVKLSRNSCHINEDFPQNEHIAPEFTNHHSKNTWLAGDWGLNWHQCSRNCCKILRHAQTRKQRRCHRILKRQTAHSQFSINVSLFFPYLFAFLHIGSQSTRHPN